MTARNIFGGEFRSSDRRITEKVKPLLRQEKFIIFSFAKKVKKKICGEKHKTEKERKEAYCIMTKPFRQVRCYQVNFMKFYRTTKSVQIGRNFKLKN